MENENKVNGNLLLKIRQNLLDLPKQQKNIANFILLNYKEAAFMTAAVLAMKADSSPTSLNRFCLKLGFKGYADFQNELKALLQSEWTALDRLQSKETNGTLNSILREEAESLVKNANIINEDVYKKALKLLCEARQLVIVGHQASEAVAVYAQYCLGKIRKNVTRFVTDVSATPGLANQLSDKDVALVFAHPRYPVRTIEALEILKKHKVKTIIVTHTELSPLANQAEVLISIPVRYHVFSDGLSPLICLVNAFAVDIFKSNEAEGKRCLEEFEDLSQYVFTKLQDN